MTTGTNNTKAQNLVLIALLGLITVFTAFYEGYFPKISGLFLAVLIAGYLISVWLALSISSKRLLSLILGIFIIEYIKEAIGIRSKLWTYGVKGQFSFGVWAWVLAGLVAYTLSTKVVIRLIRKLKFSLPRWLNLIILILIFLFFLLVPLRSSKYWSGADCLLWSFYGLLLIVGIYTSIRMDFPVFVGIVITAWIVGNPSEYAGSAGSGVWTFTHNPNYPPFFLLFGCWPLEILAQYSLSAFLANEPFDKDTF